MSDKKKRSVGIEIGPGASNTSLSDVKVHGFDVPARIDPSATNVKFNGFDISKNAPRQKFDLLSTGYSGKEHFDPKREAQENDPFSGPHLLLNEGAYRHIVEFDKLSEAFFANQPCTRVAEVDPETGDMLHKIKLTAEPPARLRYTAYAAINDLRNALDQAVCASSSVINGRAAHSAYFPFAENPKDLTGMLKSDRYSDIADGLKPFLCSLQPYPTSDAYKGGDDLLRAFAKLANPNKHQIPLGIGAKPLEGVYAIKNINATKPLDFFDAYWDSSKNEIVVARTAADGTCEYDFQLPFYISFAEAGFLLGYPVSATLSQILSKVDGIVLGLKTETEKLIATR